MTILDKSPECKELLIKKYKYIMLSNNDNFEFITNNIDLETLQTNYVFTYVVLHLRDRMFNIMLQTEQFSYYMVGNIIDNTFISKYLHQHEDIDIECHEYTIEVMDHKLQKISLTQNNRILLEKDNYKII